MKMQDWLNGARQRFDFRNWPRPSKKNAQIRVMKLSLDPRQMDENWRLEQRLPWGDSGYADYFQSTKNTRHRIMVRICEFRTHDEARLALLREISFSTAMTLPRLDKRGIRIGDVGFTGPGDVSTGILFVRYNILVDVRSVGEESLSVEEFARLIDNYIVGAGS